MKHHDDTPTINRELSWLSFNERVLQEADDPSVPLFERLNFLAIYSSNLDEFFRVRVASVRSLLRLKKKKVKKLDFNPPKLLRQIHKMVTVQQERFGAILRNQVLPELESSGIHLMNRQQLNPVQKTFLRTYFQDRIQSHLQPIVISDEDTAPFLAGRHLYLVTELWPPPEVADTLNYEPRYGLVEVPTDAVPRFVEIPGTDRKHCILFLDDVIRENLDVLYPNYETADSFAIKITRDADLYLEDEFSGNLVEMIRKSLRKREIGLPSRFLYDLHAPFALVSFLKQYFELANEDMVLGGRYHNLFDFFSFPRLDRDDLQNPPLPPLPHPELEQADSLFDCIASKDRLIHFPYQSYSYVIRFIEDAAEDPDVESISISLYRVASKSAVTTALMKAAQNGKQVTAFVEVKARFDEAPNLAWAERMETVGVRVLYSLPGLKVHAKILLVERREGSALRSYAYFGTGNFNEKTARIYTDTALLTADERLTGELRSVFDYLSGENDTPEFNHLLVAPFTMRQRFYDLIDFEIAEAEAGREAHMTVKMNSLEDTDTIARLYQAAQVGVQIRMVVRGICRLIPGVPGLSENISVTSIIDRFLEHARIYMFHHGGDEQIFLASADWMNRNLSRRIEVAFPILDEDLRREIREVMHIQCSDNVKARILDADQQNRYVDSDGAEPVRAQTALYGYFREKKVS